MCGFVAIARSPGLEPHERRATVERMTVALAHRGPDDSSVTDFDDWVAMGHRRLSIIDIEGSRQPLQNETGDVVSVFNGELYNFQTLRKRLLGLGHHFSTQGDGEVIVHGYEQWGDEIAKMLEGMFAFVLLDRPRRRLLVVRDRFGVKPVFWTRSGRGLLVASELKAIVAHPEVCRKASGPGLKLGTLRMNVPWPFTAFDDIYRLAPGTMLSFDRAGNAAMSRYAPMLAPEEPISPGENVVERTREELERAVARQMVADVPVGCFLSGGIDSTLIAALMRHRTNATLHTFSIRTSSDDESMTAAATARRLGTEHHTVDFDALSFDDLARLPAIYDEPFAETSALGVRVLSVAAREHVKVVLSGDGGDEVFGGYDTTRWVTLAARWSRLLSQGVTRRMGHLSVDLLTRARYPDAIRRALRFAALFGSDPMTAHRSLTTLSWAEDRASSQASQRLSAQVDLAAAAGLESLPPIRLAMATDRLERLPNAMLNKVDMASMSASLEVRVPMLDDALVRFAGSLETTDLVGSRRGKLVLRRVLEGLLPRGVAWAPKRGFPLPLADLMRRPRTSSMMECLLTEHADVLREVTGADVGTRWRRFSDGTTEFSAGTAARQLLWFATVALWIDRFKITDVVQREQGSVAVV